MAADLILYRDIFTTKMTLGQLFYQGSPLFLSGNHIYMGEDVARPDGIKLAKETAIWAGDGFINITWSNRFGRMMPLIYNNIETLRWESGNKYFDGVRQHQGNTEADTDACQLAGLGRNNGGVWSSHDAFDLYFPFLAKLIQVAGGAIP